MYISFAFLLKFNWFFRVYIDIFLYICTACTARESVVPYESTRNLNLQPPTGPVRFREGQGGRVFQNVKMEVADFLWKEGCFSIFCSVQNVGYFQKKNRNRCFFG